MTDHDQPGHHSRELLDGTGGRLACGCEVDEVLEQAADGRVGQLTEHQRDCPACQAALAELSRLWEPVRRLAAKHVVVPAGFKAAVAHRIGRLVSDVGYTLHLAEAGALRIAARVVAQIARDAANGAPGVEVAFGRSTHRGSARTADKATAALGVLGSTAVVDLAAAVHYGRPADIAAREVQRRAITAIRTQTGLDHVTIDDIVT